MAGQHSDPIEFARSLRRMATSPEQFLWFMLRDRNCEGRKFRRQHPIGSYVCEFYCPEAKLDVECDDDPHQTVETRKHDARPDAWRAKQGIMVLRFSNAEIDSEHQHVMQEIAAALRQRTVKNSSPPAPLLDESRRGEKE